MKIYFFLPIFIMSENVHYLKISIYKINKLKMDTNIYITWDPESIRELDRRQRGIQQQTPVNNLIQERDDDLITSLIREKIKDNR